MAVFAGLNLSWVCIAVLGGRDSSLNQAWGRRVGGGRGVGEGRVGGVAWYTDSWIETVWPDYISFGATCRDVAG